MRFIAVNDEGKILADCETLSEVFADLEDRGHDPAADPTEIFVSIGALESKVGLA